MREHVSEVLGKRSTLRYGRLNNARRFRSHIATEVAQNVRRRVDTMVLKVDRQVT